MKSVKSKWRQFLHGVAVLGYVLVIGGVSLYDILLTIRYRDSLYDLELNPFGRWIMDLDNVPIDGVSPGFPPDVGPFLVAKSLGTVVVLAVIVALVWRLKRLGHSVAIGVSGFQIALAAYLTFG
jgi:hypothetical protein